MKTYQVQSKYGLNVQIINAVTPHEAVSIWFSRVCKQLKKNITKDEYDVIEDDALDIREKLLETVKEEA